MAGKKGVNRKAFGEASFNYLYRVYKRTAKYRGFEFTLSKDDFRDITSLCCEYCGDAPINVSKGEFYGDYVYNGIDRVDSRQGYILENSVPCCWECNQIKGVMVKEEFLSQVKKIVEHLGLNDTSNL